MNLLYGLFLGFALAGGFSNSKYEKIEVLSLDRTRVLEVEIDPMIFVVTPLMDSQGNTSTVNVIIRYGTSGDDFLIAIPLWQLIDLRRKYED